MSHTSATMKPLVDADLRRTARLMTLSAPWHAVARAATTIAAWYRRRRELRHNIAALSALSDHMLKDIGMHRSEIASIAHSRSDTAHDRR
jgi:uncharacterized protein YjiS (DUF1127 family)